MYNIYRVHFNYGSVLCPIDKLRYAHPNSSLFQGLRFQRDVKLHLYLYFVVQCSGVGGKITRDIESIWLQSLLPRVAQSHRNFTVGWCGPSPTGPREKHLANSFHSFNSFICESFATSLDSTIGICSCS